MNNAPPIRVRFAPSPTGDLHIGGLRVALFNWLFARQHGGIFILRIEDTDQKRYQPQSVRSIVEGMKWAGLDWEEGPTIEVKSQKSKVKSEGVPSEQDSQGSQILERGEYGPYFQSQRTETYRTHVELLLKNGNAYPCFCTPDRLEEMRKQQEAMKLPPMYDKCCRKLSAEEAAKKLDKGIPHVVRLKIPDAGRVEITDLIHGNLSFNLSLVDDQVLMKSDGFPTYHLANVIDDHFMRITHVLRGDDWISSLPKHILLYRAFQWEQPQYGHLPMILAPDKTRLSKRHGAVSVLAFRDAGYIPEALLNFTLLLGWNPGKGSAQEIFSKEQMFTVFSFDGIQKSPAVFNYEKLKWVNSHYIKLLSPAALVAHTLPILLKAGLIMRLEERMWTTADGRHVNEQYIHNVLTLIQPRMDIFNDEIIQDLDYFFSVPVYDPSMLIWKKGNREGALHMLKEMLNYLDAHISVSDEIQKDRLEAEVKQWISDRSYNNGEVLWPLRVAVTGREKSPSPFEVITVLGKAETLSRMRHAIENL